jgi:hypothetical protein
MHIVSRVGSRAMYNVECNIYVMNQPLSQTFRESRVYPAICLKNFISEIVFLT